MGNPWRVTCRGCQAIILKPDSKPQLGNAFGKMPHSSHVKEPYCNIRQDLGSLRSATRDQIAPPYPSLPFYSGNQNLLTLLFLCPILCFISSSSSSSFHVNFYHPFHAHRLHIAEFIAARTLNPNNQLILNDDFKNMIIIQFRSILKFFNFSLDIPQVQIKIYTPHFMNVNECIC